MLNNQKVIAVILNRVGSSRLPKKGALPIPWKGINFLTQDHIAMRLNQVNRMFENSIYKDIIDKVIVAFPDTEDDRKFVEHNNRLRDKDGSLLPEDKFQVKIVSKVDENSVIERVLKVVNEEKANIIIEITADCPFLDPEHVARMLPCMTDLDYISNVFRFNHDNFGRLLPDGLDIQIYKTYALDASYNILKPESNEIFHCGYNIVQLIRKHYLDNIDYLYFDCTDWFPFYEKGWAFTLDEKEDYRLLRLIANNFKNKKDLFRWEDIKNLINQKPELLNIIKNVRRKNPELEA